ncbi:DUF4192 domain-containing protein [Dactylosporangium sp. NPDC049140]|uniref:DUF4192 domain-containing protein n=1 Tax=Dactylosporangium sp. NPDC049140 TaxID=3155647 RepID=UPI0033CF9DD6
MSATHRPTLRVHSIEDLAALIPYLLGFHPHDSLVLVSVEDTTNRIRTAVRLDLPPADAPSADLDMDAVLRRAVAVLDEGVSISAVLAGYGPVGRVEPTVTVAGEALHAAGVAVRTALRVADGRVWCLRCTDPPACPSDGIPFEAATNPAAVAAVYAGLVALPDRDALAATLAPVTGPARQRMIAATVAACGLLADVLDAARTDSVAHHDRDNTGDTGEDPHDDPDAVLDSRLGRALQAAARTYLTQLQARYRDGRPADDEHAATVTVLLDLPSLWEFAARATTGEAWQIQMWSDLARRAEPPFTAPAATLLALCALQAGHGALAAMAVDRALAADPQDRFAQLLHQAIATGIDPATVTALLSPTPGTAR